MWKLKAIGVGAITGITTAIIVSSTVLAASEVVETTVDIASAALAYSAIVSLINKDNKKDTN